MPGSAAKATARRTLSARHGATLDRSDLHAGDGLLMFWSHTPVAPWQDREMAGTDAPATATECLSAHGRERFVSTESTFIDMAWWDRCVEPDASMLQSDRSLALWVGVDASVKRDSTAIVGVTWDRQSKKTRLIAHRIFQPSAIQSARFRGHRGRDAEQSACPLLRARGLLRSLSDACHRHAACKASVSR